jgi:pimeloyl-ACP methyl ester carboxylesterase
MVFALVLYQWLATAADRRSLKAPGKLVDVGTGRLHLLCSGTGAPTVVLEAGIAASSLSWSRVQPGVAAFAHVCSYDRAGLAWSDATSQPMDAAHLADQLHTLLVSAAVPPPYVLVGHSFGSFVARMFANRHPNLVAGMVLVDPIYPAEWLHMSRERKLRLSGGIFLSQVGALLAGVGVVRLCLQLLAHGRTSVPRGVSRMFGSEAATVLRRLVGEVQKLPESAWPAVRAHWSQPKCFRSMAGHLRRLTASAEQVAQCGTLGDIPLLVITAPSQPAACRSEHARIAALSSRGRHVVAPAGGHWVQLDAPDVLVDAIREVVTGIRERV